MFMEILNICMSIMAITFTIVMGALAIAFIIFLIKSIIDFIEGEND